MCRVSVIITTFNRGGFLQEAVASVRAQSYSDYELIIADDGSTDNTPQVVAAFGGPVRYLRLQHSGRPSVSRNRALALATGEFVAFLDDDDLWREDKLAQQVVKLDAEPDAGLVYTDFVFLDATGGTSSPALVDWQRQEGRLFTALLRDCFIHPSTVMLRRSLLKQVGEFDESLSIVEDYDLWLRVARASRIVFLPDPLVHVRRYSQGISRQRAEAVAWNTLRTFEKVAAEASLTGSEHFLLLRRRAWAHSHLGHVLLDLGEVGPARNQLLRAVLLNPLQTSAWRGLLQSLGRG